MADTITMPTRTYARMFKMLGRGSVIWLDDLRRSSNARANKIAGGDSGNLVSRDSDGDIQDVGQGAPFGVFVGDTDEQTLLNKTLAEAILFAPVLSEVTASRLLVADANKVPVSVEDLTAWIAGSTGITVTDDGDGTITITVKQQGHIADASVAHVVADTGETCDRSDIEDKLDAMGTKINTILAALEAAEILATS